LKRKRYFLEPHVAERARQRYGIDLRDGEYEEIVQMIVKNKAALIEIQKDGRRKYIVEFCGQFIPLIFDHTYNLIVTFLPPQCLSNYARVLKK